MTEPDLGEDLNRRFEYAKAFYAKSKLATKPDERKTYVEVCFALGFSFLEGTLSYISDHFADSRGFDTFERSIMNEQDLRIVRGQPQAAGVKYRTLEERLQFLFWRFSHKPFDTQQKWWSALKQAINQRNDLMHPKKGAALTEDDAERCLLAILEATDCLFKTVFNNSWPKAKRGLLTSVEV